MGTSIIRNSDVVTVYRAPVVIDEYNREVRDWSNAVAVKTGRASIQHYMALEEDIDRQTETEGARLFTDTPDMKGQIEAVDRVLYDGRYWEVTSPPQEYRLFSRYHHTEMFVRLVEG
ncbi:MAG: hypothetical protein ABW007_11360 [Chitinophagaceae bacterium]